MKKILNRDEALLAMADLCARSEQCSFEITRKLSKKGLSRDDIEFVVSELNERGFIDDMRYARSFSRDKVRFSAWGRMKIRMALIAKHIPSFIISEALNCIDSDDYAAAVQRAARSKAPSLDLSLYDDRLRLYRFLISRGFESRISSAEVKRQRIIQSESEE